MPGLEKYPKSERLRGRREYLRVYREGRKLVGSTFICFRVRQAGQGRKFGMAVTRKVGGAVVRNRIKRYLREIYRTRRQRMIDDVHIVVVALPRSADLNFHECETAVENLWEDSGVFRG